MSLKNKLIVLVAVLLLFCGLVGIVGYQSSQKIAKSYSVIEEVNLPNMNAINRSVISMRGARISLLHLILPNQSPEEIVQLKEQIAADWKTRDTQDKIYNEIPFSEGEEAVYKPVKDLAETLRQDFAKALEFHTKSGGKEGPSMDAARHVVDEVMEHGSAYRDANAVLVKFHQNKVKESSDAAHVAKSTGTTWIIAGILGALVFGGILSFIVLKNVVVEQERTTKALIEATRSFNMVEKSSVSTAMGSVDGKLIYINEIAKVTLKKLQQHLPDQVDNLIGKNFDFIHKNPSEQSLPIKTLVSIGTDKLDVAISAIYDQNGKYIGPMLTWEIATERVALVNDLTKASEDLASAASNVLSISSSLSAAAEETSAQANTASVASEEVNAGVQTVASNMEEMTAAIKEITKTTNEAASMTNEAMRMAKNANQIINQLGDSSMDIGNVIKVISSIAQQTNLLALNATIEAARAGEAGKGFAVVANEVKELANQTAKATSEITKKIETIQADSKNAVEAIAEISGAIEKVNGYTGNIAASVEEQAATTNEVTRIVAESAEGVKQINENINQVSQAAANTGRDAGNAQNAARGVGDTAELLKKYVARLKA